MMPSFSGRYGRAAQEVPGNKSQSTQLDEKSARELFMVYGRFTGLR